MNTRWDARLDPFIEAALTHIVQKGWRDFSLKGLDHIETLEGEYAPPWQDRFAFLRDFGRMIDAKVANEMEGEGADPCLTAGLSPKERLFDVLMARFDALKPYRAGIEILTRAALFDPGLSGSFACSLPRSMRHMLALAHIRNTGIEGALKARVLSGLWLHVLRIWLRDDSLDLGKTMAALDRALGRIEPIGEQLFPHDRSVQG